jgi:membrane protease subunit HflC
VRRELGHAPLLTLLTAQRGDIVEAIKNEVQNKANPLGVEIDEVRFHRADLPFETSQAIYDRMKSERQREAKELRAQGAEWAQQIQSRADRDRTVLLSEAQRAATISRGEGDAAANRVLAEAFDKDPSFYKFYRALQTYRSALADSGPTLVLSPDADFLWTLENGPKPPQSAPTPPAPGSAP